ncbi:Mbov_0401 family ICE element transposase-like protein [Spiroplasma sp. DGKH1]|uniref:Mbov_0401 family ICE element transposase-like protein n=1 Tax=Spiroplasma sp. DGKH1 TaxID=3050074 RepID=UPI0034C6785E
MIYDFNPYDFFIDFNRAAIEKYKEELVSKFQKIDEELFQYIRKANPTYKLKGYRKRKLISIFGEIQLNLHRYKYWDSEKYNSKTKEYGKWRYTVLFLQHIKLQKYQRLTHDLRLTILNMIGDGLRHKDILLAFPKDLLTTQTISNVIKRVKIADHIDNSEITKIDVTALVENKIHIALDDTFIKAFNKKKKKSKFRIRSLTTYTGHDKDESFYYRKILENKKSDYKMVKIAEGIKTVDYVDEILAHINKYYIINADTKFIVGGDGAKWISEVANILGAEYVLDKFHAMRLIKKLLSIRTSEYHKNHFKNARELFSKGDVDRLLELINSFKGDPLIHKQDKIQQVYNYIKRNRKGIESYQYSWCLGVCAEGQISHNFKQTLGYGAKILNEEILRNMIDLRLAKLNGFKPIEALIDNELTELKELDQFNKTTRWINTKNITEYKINEGSTPIIYSGNHSLARAVKTIITY